jgi:hypothetical protein
LIHSWHSWSSSLLLKWWSHLSRWAWNKLLRINWHLAHLRSSPLSFYFNKFVT